MKIKISLGRVNRRFEQTEERIETIKNYSIWGEEEKQSGKTWKGSMRPVGQYQAYQLMQKHKNGQKKYLKK